ncbi:hypothetical protein [Maribacter arenosus]|uniref:Uncharacterized protein n=1 Tax=Maribacter arenosus TaxID=1854708 RepID=A0ABR7V9B7_9FLAO|nr:hypothetical protein [Maribacter arenosus]MBD0850192.1 hypothetical protein [Maribacter arenosus]
MARRVYGILIVIALGLGFYIYTLRESHSNVFMIITSGFIFTVLSMGVHGIIAHSLNPKAKGGILLYPLLMGVLWAFLFFLFVFFILPIFCPDFLIQQ